MRIASSLEAFLSCSNQPMVSSSNHSVDSAHGISCKHLTKCKIIFLMHTELTQVSPYHSLHLPDEKNGVKVWFMRLHYDDK